MGAVWMADQTEPVKRRVALKLIKTGSDSKPIIARFEAERQALALMDHPSIAKILDGGTTESGQPYFVMELVAGIPITQYCDKHRLSLPERLGLFTQVCNAIQHAHQKGIIHRDLKPANILVGVYDGKPVPKVIDFGLAKALDHQSKLTDKTLFTEFGAVVGTLQYMSPEQANLDANDIDTRADIYALGVLLYELLTGSTPIEIATLKQLALMKVLASIRDTDPPRPSARLSSSSHQLPSISDNRQIDPARLQSELRGDLDWIVMKALEKDRSRRYESASGFAADIERYLTDQPVVARPPTAVYRLGKFFKKNRGPVIAALVMFALLLAGLIGTLWGLEVARSQLRRAETAESETNRKAIDLQKVVEFQSNQLRKIDLEKMAHQMAEGIRTQYSEKLLESNLSPDAKEAEQSAFLAGTFRVNFIDIASKTLSDSVFAPAIQSLDKDYDTMPDFQANLFQVLGTTLKDLGLPNAAEYPLEKSYQLSETTYGKNDAKSIISKLHLGTLYMDMGALERAEPLIRQATDSAQRVLGEQSKEYIDGLEQLAIFEEGIGQLESAEKSLRNAEVVSKSVHGESHQVTLRIRNSLGYVLESLGKTDEAESIYRQVIEKTSNELNSTYPTIDERTHATASTLNNLGSLLDTKSDFENSQKCFEDAYRIAQRYLGDSHPETLTSLNNIAFSLTNQNKLIDGERMQRKAVSMQRQALGVTHPHTLRSMGNLSYVLQKMGRFEDSEALRRESLRFQELAMGTEHPDSLSSKASLAQLLMDRNQLDEAERLLVFVVDARQRILPPGDPKTLSSITFLARLYRSSNRLDEATKLIRLGQAIQEKTSPKSDTAFVRSQMELARILIEQSLHNEAEDILKKVRLSLDDKNDNQVPVQVLALLREDFLNSMKAIYTATDRQDLIEKLK